MSLFCAAFMLFGVSLHVQRQPKFHEYNPNYIELVFFKVLSNLLIHLKNNILEQTTTEILTHPECSDSFGL